MTQKDMQGEYIHVSSNKSLQGLFNNNNNNDHDDDDDDDDDDNNNNKNNNTVTTGIMICKSIFEL